MLRVSLGACLTHTAPSRPCKLSILDLTRAECRGIGISNFNAARVEELLKTAKVKPAANQCGVKPPFFSTQGLFKLNGSQFCQDRASPVRYRHG
jgi:hypothetical protein